MLNAISDFFQKMFLRRNKIERSNSAFSGSIMVGIVALIILMFYALSAVKCINKADCVSVYAVLGHILLTAFAAFCCGGMAGFLFGIPRTLQHSDNPAEASNYSQNTNLEQISDWLTKILVGVGLTQIHKIITKFNELCLVLGNTFDPYIPTKQFASITGTTLIIFLIDGFLIMYLWTRLFLAKIQDGTSLEDKINSKIQDNDANDKQATSIANNQLYLPIGVPDFTVDDLQNAFKKASGNAISNIFFKAVSIRKNNWEKDKPRMERVIPIFRALINMDSSLEFPENFAEVGYAMKDKSVPDYAEALNYLLKAIKGFRDKDNTQGIAILYFNTAYCRIQLDNNYKSGLPSSDEMYTQISNDIQEAGKESYVKDLVDADGTIAAWKKINSGRN
jgi:tetratricopeptide (TPR) repeat protein